MEQVLARSEVETSSDTLGEKLRSKNVRRNRYAKKPQLTDKLVLEAKDKRYHVENVTDYNFQIESDGSFENGNSYEGRILNDQNPLFDISFRTRLITGNKVQCRFSDLSIEKRQQLVRYLKQSKNPDAQGDSLNRMSYDDIASGITSVSGPKDVVEEGAVTDSQVEQAGVRKSTRLLVALLLLGAIIGIILAAMFMVQSRNRVDIKNAALVGNYLPIQSSAEGLVTSIGVRGGQEVRAGDVLFRVQNRQVETEVALAQAEIDEARAQVMALEQLIVDYHGKLELVAENITQRILVAEADLRRAQLVSRAQTVETESNSELHDSGMISELEFEKSKTQQQILLTDIQAKRAELGILEVDYRAATENGILSMGDVLEDQLGQLKSDLTLAQANENRAVANRDTLALNQVEVQAPSNGRIYAVYRQKGEFVKLAEPILSISLYDQYWASGSVNSEEAHRILPGQEVQVKISSMDLVVTGEVAAVGHRAVYTQGGWSQDFRGAGLAVPVKVWLPTLPEDVPSGIRMKMVVDLGFKWPWQDDDKDEIGNEDEREGHGVGDVLIAANAATFNETDVIQHDATDDYPSERGELIPISASTAAVNDVNNWYANLASDLSADLQGLSGTRVFHDKPGVVNIRITNQGGFRSGEDVLATSDSKTIELIGAVLRERSDVNITIEGHTDNVLPSPTDKYSSNQALSLARATSVQKLLEFEIGVPDNRLEAVGKADFYPVASNDIAIGRRQNRRIEFVLTRRSANEE